MLLCNFFKILLPIHIEPQLLLALTIESFHNALHATLKPSLKACVSFIPSLNYCLMMVSIGNLNFPHQLILASRAIVQGLC